MAKDSGEILSQVSHLHHGDSSEKIYDDWSKTYDAHLLDDFGYISPDIAAQLLADEIEQRDIKIIDYGCGTGLVGMALAAKGFSCIDGMDISEGMLEQAADKNIYRHLTQGDLTQPVALEDGIYDAGLCIGSMGAGHVGAEHAVELLRAIKPGGLFVIVVNGKYYQSDGFDRVFPQLEQDGLWRIRKLEQFNYMSELDRPGWLLLAERL